MRLQVQIIVERFDNENLVRKFRNMGNHLERGGAVGFALDTDKVWAGFVDPGPLSQGAVTLPTPGGNAWSSWSTGSLADDDPIVLQSAPPESILEHHTMDGSALSTATSILLDTGIETDHTQGPHLVRHRDFWPSLKMPEDQVRRLSERGICYSHRRLNHTLDLTLIEDWGAIRASSSTFAPQMPGETAGSPVRFQQMEDPGVRAVEPTYPTVHPYFGV